MPRRADRSPKEPESRVRTLVVFAPLRSSHPKPWLEVPAASRGIRPAISRCTLARIPSPGPPLEHRSSAASHPSTDMPPSVHSRARSPVRFGTEGAIPRHPVPSSWFCATSTVSSARRSRACCIPLPIWGSPRFTCPSSRPCPAETGHDGSVDTLPATLSPPEEFPPTTAAPRHRGRCPLAVPPHPSPPFHRRRCQRRCSGSHQTQTPTSRLCSITGSVAPSPPLPAEPRPILPGLSSPPRSSRKHGAPALPAPVPSPLAEEGATPSPHPRPQPLPAASRRLPARSVSRRAGRGGWTTGDRNRRSTCQTPRRTRERVTTGLHRPATEIADDASYIGFELAHPRMREPRRVPTRSVIPHPVPSRRAEACRDCRTSLSRVEVARSASLSPARSLGPRREAHIARPSWGS
jgi:hypothetical protein